MTSLNELERRLSQTAEQNTPEGNACRAAISTINQLQDSRPSYALEAYAEYLRLHDQAPETPLLTETRAQLGELMGGIK